MEWGSEPALASTAAPRYVIYVLNTFQPWLETLVWYEINLSIWHQIRDIYMQTRSNKLVKFYKGFMSRKNELINSQKE